MKFYIYKITNMLTGKIYVGQHKVREGETLRSYMGRGGRLLKDYKKFGRKIFSKEILEYLDDDEKHLLVDEREKFWIKELGADKTGYNINPGGKNVCLPETAMLISAVRKANGYRPSEETKSKMSAAAKGVPKSDIHKQHLSDNHRTKTEHTIVFEDGRESVKTTEAKYKIAEKYGVSLSSLIRRSEKNLFTGGIKLLELYEN